MIPAGLCILDGTARGRQNGKTYRGVQFYVLPWGADGTVEAG